MIETLEIGSSPYEEVCAQVGEDNYSVKARQECKEFIAQLKRHYQSVHGTEFPDNCRLIVKSNQHDFGTYYEVAAKFDENDDKAGDAAYWLEGNTPAKWDEEAKRNLTI